jgi:hypothetical protein
VDVRVDLEREAPIPHDDHVAVVADLLDNAAVSDMELACVVRDAEELDASADADACTNAGCEETGAVRIHVWCIGWNGGMLDGR